MSNKRKRQSRRSSASSSSSVSSSSTAGADCPSAGAGAGPGSVFSGFWSDAELEAGARGDQEESGSGKGGEKADTDYEGFYLTIGDVVYEIGVGDAVAMRSPGGKAGDADAEGAAGNDRDERRRRRLKRMAEEEAAAGGNKGASTSANPNPAGKGLPPSDADYEADATTGGAGGYYRPGEKEGTAKGTEAEAKANSRPSGPGPKAPPPAKAGDGLMLARVERVWKETGRRGRVLFRARWFLSRGDVDALPLGDIEQGPIGSAKRFANAITGHDLVLSDQCDDNHLTTICGLVQVLYRNPASKEKMPTTILPTTYLCRYSLRIDDGHRVVILPYTGLEDAWSEMTPDALDAKKRPAGQVDSDRDDEDGEPGYPSGSPEGKYLQSSGHGGSDGNKRRRVGDFAADEGIDEGTTEQRDIQVGSNYQVGVPPFVPNDPTVVVASRNPVRLWKPGAIGQKGQDDYIERASRILTPYLREHHLTQEEPYAPLPTERMEELAKSMDWRRLPTLSSVSTFSSLATQRVDALREVDIDALLRNLHVSNYSVDAAIAAIEASPRDYIAAWSPHEKARFNAGFRRYSGSLRAIYKGMGDKALPEVIDYHYRFKIPDQFRRFQERKREQAVRMLECIETRRNSNAPIVVSKSILVGPQGGGAEEHHRDGRGDWMKAGSSSFNVSVEERRVKAKELLLDVEANLGTETMLKVFGVLKNADETTLVQCKTKLLDIFRGHKEFQTRFLEFLPQQMRL